MQNADNAGREGTGKTLSDDFFVRLSGSLEKNIQKGTVFQEIMAKDIRNGEDNMAMGDVKHAFSERVSPLHVVEISA